MTYYHFSASVHSIDTILQPGNWGRRLDSSRYWNPSGMQIALESFDERQGLLRATAAVLKTVFPSARGDEQIQATVIEQLSGLSAAFAFLMVVSANAIWRILERMFGQLPQKLSLFAPECQRMASDLNDIKKPRKH